MARKIRVLQVIDMLGPGGAEMLIFTLAAALDHSRFEMHVCTLRKLPGFHEPDMLRSMGVPLLALDQHNSYDVPALLSIVRYVVEKKIDLIHTHLLGGDVMGRMAGFLTGRPVVSTIHNSREDLDHEPRHRQWLEKWTARLMCRRLIVVSSLLRKETAGCLGVPLRKVVAITNGVDTERFCPPPGFDGRALKEELLGGDFPMVLSVGRFVPQKAQSVLIDASHIVCRTRPDVRFVFLGYGAELEKLQAQTARLGLTENVLFAGHRSNVPEMLAACDIFAMSSVAEGLPVALLEAMSAGCPCVATTVGGVPEVLRDGVTGLLVPPSNPEALAVAITRLLNDPALARSLGCTAQSWVNRNLSQRAWASRLERLYLHELHRS